MSSIEYDGKVLPQWPIGDSYARGLARADSKSPDVRLICARELELDPTAQFVSLLGNKAIKGVSEVGNETMHLTRNFRPPFNGQVLAKIIW